MTQPVYAIGDIHGQLEELHRVLELIEQDGGPDAHIVFVGDYVDRGPDSRGVVELLMSAQAENRPWNILRGNHDRYLTRFLSDGTVYDARTRPDLFWFNPLLGGDKTLASYGVTAEDGMPLEPVLAAAREAVPSAHRAFLESLPLTCATSELLFVHAGIRPGIALADQKEDDLIWIREGFLDHKESFGPLVVHGHTALDHPEHAGNRVNLDGGAGFFRPLHAAVFEGRDCWLLSDRGRLALRP